MEAQLGHLLSSGDLQQHEKVDHGWGKQTTLPSHRCARHAGNEISFRSVYLFVVCILPEQLLSATRCRVGCHRIKAGVVALGESLRLIVAERPH